MQFLGRMDVEELPHRSAIEVELISDRRNRQSLVVEGVYLGVTAFVAQADATLGWKVGCCTLLLNWTTMLITPGWDKRGGACCERAPW